MDHPTTPGGIMKVTICGPNLRDDSKGTFHVHAAGCADLKHYGPRGKFGGEDSGWTLEVQNRVEVVEDVYADQLDENPDMAEDWLSDFHFLPCTKELT